VVGGAPTSGRVPVLLASAVAIAGPVLFTLFPSTAMFWASLLFCGPLFAVLAWERSRTDEEEDDCIVPDPVGPMGPDMWGPPW